MNALFYGFQFPHHGRFSAFSALSAEMKKNGINVCDIHFPDIPLWVPGRIRGPAAQKWYEANECRLKKAFKSGETVHYFFPENSLFRAPEWKRNGALVLSCHQPAQQIIKANQCRGRKYFLEGLKSADAVVLMASCEIDAYRELSSGGNVFCIPHGVDTDFFSPVSAAPDPAGIFRILTVGNWLRDYPLWAQVVEQVAGQSSEVEFSVLANADQLAAATANLKSARGKVRILRGISDEQLREEYQRTDLIFLPLINAWANNALLEGMACGKPVVATDLPAIREYAGSAARFVEKGSVDAAVAEILRLIPAKKERGALGEQARQRMVSAFSWNTIAQQYLNLYATLGDR
jgi:glycosyltransferase involved in cell wall biosynthesis